MGAAQSMPPLAPDPGGRRIDWAAPTAADPEKGSCGQQYENGPLRFLLRVLRRSVQPAANDVQSIFVFARIGDSVEHDIPATTNAWPVSCPRPRSQTLYDNVCRMGPAINKRKAQDREAVCRTDDDALLLLASELQISPFI